MEKHIKTLKGRCRLCRGKAKKEYGYKNIVAAIEFKQHIQSLFNHDLGTDTEEVHPTNLCGNCVRKLRNVNHEYPIHHVQSIATFEQHSSAEDCEVCNLRMTLHEFKMITMEYLTLSKLIQFSKKFSFTYAEKLKQHTFVRICDRGKDSNDESVISPAFIDLTVLVEEQKDRKGKFSWTMSVFDQNIDKTMLNAVPEFLTIDTVETFFQTIRDFRVCQGNNDVPNLIQKRKEGHSDKRDNTRLECLDLTPFEKLQPTIRHKDCPRLIFGPAPNSARCDKCSIARKSLLVLEKRPSLTSTKPKPKRPHASLSKGQLKTRLSDVSQENAKLKLSIKRLEKRIKTLVKRDGVFIKDQATSEFMSKMVESKPDFEFKDGSPMKLLWEQQLKASKLKKSTSMRWHPVMIRWALSLYLRSPGIHMTY